VKILEQNLKQHEITVQVQDLNDLWTLYNIISKDDEVSALTQRRVVMKEGSPGERKLMRLKLKVEDVAFHEFSNRLRIKGTIIEGPDDFVSYGSYHTINLETNQNITLIKDEWLRTDLKRLKEASKLQPNFKILFIAMETGLANVALITNYSHTTIATIKRSIPGKRYEQKFRNTMLKDFYEDVKTVLEQKAKANDLNLIVICGPGSRKDDFAKFLRENSDEVYLSKIRTIHASSGTESAIYETLKSQELQKFKEKAKILEATEKIEEVMKMLATDPDLVAIGMDEVSTAAQMGAIKLLLLVDLMIRGSSKENKLKIEEIITNVENTAGEVEILSSQHTAGEQLMDLGSIVAILRYKF
jgi:protein pelota